MRIAVLLKQVPESTDVQVDPETGTLRREGAAAMMNPFDTYALEEALRGVLENRDDLPARRDASAHFAREHWDWEVCADQYCALFTEVVGE